MKRNLNLVFALPLICLLIFALCESFAATPDSTYSNNLSSPEPVEEVISYCRKAIEGEIVKAEKKHSRETTFWEINVITSSGSSVKIKITPEGGRIFEAVSSEGPFDYDLNPGEDLMSFEKVRTEAEANSGTKLLKWKLTEAKSGMQYHFWFFTKGGAAQYKVNAVTGERIMKKQGRKKKDS